MTMPDLNSASKPIKIINNFHPKALKRPDINIAKICTRTESAVTKKRIFFNSALDHDIEKHDIDNFMLFFPTFQIL